MKRQLPNTRIAVEPSKLTPISIRRRQLSTLTTVAMMMMVISSLTISFCGSLPPARAFMIKTTITTRGTNLLATTQRHFLRALPSSVRQQQPYSALSGWTTHSFQQRSSPIVLLSSSSPSHQPYSSDTAAADETDASGYSRPVVQWYPGHIAKAERMLKETFKAVDVVVEVRDARAAKATSHPMVGAWCAGRPRLVVMTHVDQIPTSSRRAWQDAYEKFGAEHPDQADVIDLQIQNQAKQAFQERLKYTTTITTTSKSKSNNKRQQQQRGSSSSIVNTVEDVLFVNAKVGSGIHALKRAIFKAGAHVQERRERRGLKDRPLRVGIIGYPNVGKSALINRLLGRRRARTANTPGVTRSLQWIRVKNEESKQKGKEFELLDSPGIIPATLVDQSDATLLAACNCIGDAAYDNQAVAAYLCEWLLSLYRLGYGEPCAPDWRDQCQKRYGFDPLQDKPVVPSTDIEQEDEDAFAPWTGEDMLFEVADRTCQGNAEDAARKILQDFRAGRMGLICLQVAPVSSEEKGQRIVIGGDAAREREERQQAFEEAQRDRARKALETAKERGLELPPVVLGRQQEDRAETKRSSSSADDQVGKGMFEGW